MKKSTFISFFCFMILSFVALAVYVHAQNEKMRIKMVIPMIAKQVKALEEKNVELLYQIEKFESPEYLLKLAESQEFAHLHFPSLEQVVVVQEGIALLSPEAVFETKDPASLSSKATIAAQSVP